MSGPVRPALWRARVVLLLAVAVFAVAVLASTRRLERAYEASSNIDNEAVWIAYQLEFELQRLLLAIERYRGKPADASRDDLALRFDLLWSRIPPVRQGEDGALLRRTTRIEPVVSDLERLLVKTEPHIAAARPDPAALEPFARQLEAFRVPLRQVVLDALAESARRQERVHADLRAHLSANRLATLGLAGTLLALLALLWFDRRRTHDLLDRSREETREVRHLAERDELTGLANRRLFERRLAEMLRAARRHRERFALMLLDLDRFKSVNDTLGHAAGDRLLQAVAGRLRGQLRQSDLVARLGGDEFAILQADVGDAGVARGLARRLAAALSQTCEIEGHRIRIGASIGIALAPDHALERERLFRLADAALYRAKTGEGPVCFAAGSGKPEREAAGETRRPGVSRGA